MSGAVAYDKARQLRAPHGGGKTNQEQCPVALAEEIVGQRGHHAPQVCRDQSPLSYGAGAMFTPDAGPNVAEGGKTQPL